MIEVWKYYSVVSSHNCRSMTCMYIQSTFYHKKESKHLLKDLHKSSMHVDSEKKSKEKVSMNWMHYGSNMFFFTDEWSKISTRSIVPLPGFEHVDTITSTSECITIEAGLTWIPVCDANARVRMVPYVSTLGIHVVQSRPGRATIVTLTSQVWK